MKIIYFLQNSIYVDDIDGDDYIDIDDYIDNVDNMSWILVVVWSFGLK
jgi:hypothetical protein